MRVYAGRSETYRWTRLSGGPPPQWPPRIAGDFSLPMALGRAPIGASGSKRWAGTHGHGVPGARARCT